MAAGHRQLGRLRDIAWTSLYHLPEGETITLLDTPIKRLGKNWYRTPYAEMGLEGVIENLQRRAKFNPEAVAREPMLASKPKHGPPLPPGTSRG